MGYTGEQSRVSRRVSWLRPFIACCCLLLMIAAALLCAQG